MCETTNEKKWTLLELLDKYSVQIPKIQRDYAQGRNSDKIKKIRQKFLRNIFDALENDDSEMNLEFIYGSTDDQKTLFPLDGQQRLTTLFLLHWFCCIAGVRDKQQLKWLRKFSYTTRHDAEMFCKLLTDDESFGKIKAEFEKSDKNKSCISDIIKNQPKFLSAYNSDPTASGMMVMLNAIQNKFQNALARLENLDNINFYFLPLEKFALTDELYIKMNHRGKQLTEFEIFKAQIAECLPKLMRKDIMKLFDQKYTDYFWSIYKTYKETFDNEMLNFLRFAFFIDYYKKHGSFEDYIIKSEEAKEKSEETHEETTPQNKSEKKCFYDLFKGPSQNSNIGKEEKDTYSNSDRLDHYILQSYKNNFFGGAQDILTTFMSHTVEEDCKRFFCSGERNSQSVYVELFNQANKNLFIRACAFDPNPRNNPFPYAEQIFMFALYLYYKEQLNPEIFLKRFRILRNLVRNSENVREEFLTKWLEITENIIKTGKLASDLRGGKICSAEMYDYELRKLDLSEEDQKLLAEAENHPAIHGFAIGFISKDNNSYRVNTKLLQYFLEIVPADNAAEQLKLLRKALLVCCDFSAPYSKDVPNVRLIPQNENIEDWRYFTIPTAQRQKNQFFDALEILRNEAGTDLEEYIKNQLDDISRNECYYFVKYADYIFPFGNYGYYCQGEKNSANALLLKSSRWGDDNIRWNMHLYIINKIWNQETGKWFLQGDKNNSLTLRNHATVSLVSCDDHFRLTSLDREHLSAALKESANGVVCEIENSGGYYYDLAIPQNNGVDEVDRIEYLFENLNL